MERSQEQVFPIGAVERETGILKETLRIWERRYGFPRPTRSASGERLYSADDLTRLRLVKRLIDQGRRPGGIVTLPVEQLRAEVGAVTRTDTQLPALLESVSNELRRGVRSFRLWLDAALAARGTRNFVTEIAAPLCDWIGAAWESGEMSGYQERLFNEQLRRVLNRAIDGTPDSGAQPRVLLATVAGDAHGLGLLMAEALLRDAGAECLALGAQTPTGEIAACAAAERADVVAVSFSAGYPGRSVISALKEVRRLLRPETELWVSGMASVNLANRVANARVLTTLASGLAALDAWRAAHPQAARGPAATNAGAIL